MNCYSVFLPSIWHAFYPYSSNVKDSSVFITCSTISSKMFRWEFKCSHYPDLLISALSFWVMREVRSLKNFSPMLFRLAAFKFFIFRIFICFAILSYLFSFWRPSNSHSKSLSFIFCPFSLSKYSSLIGLEILFFSGESEKGPSSPIPFWLWINNSLCFLRMCTNNSG